MVEINIQSINGDGSKSGEMLCMSNSTTNLSAKTYNK